MQARAPRRARFLNFNKGSNLTWRSLEPESRKNKSMMKGGKPMTYEKPEIVPLGPASESIQNNLKGIGVLEAQTPRRPTNGAYLADE
jgi:hypothetical protein